MLRRDEEVEGQGSRVQGDISRNYTHRLPGAQRIKAYSLKLSTCRHRNLTSFHVIFKLNVVSVNDLKIPRNLNLWNI